ncbi:high choriolytic enzyme 1-like [Protopterus annectens]|uniref:high choriolytic enzyme 1-like n=1 Tax=Protopterus annectens TaxID=7888 RepID=UPI001CF9FE0D|nr:high choriolytic enzyme 1-like [Protopterus annectens]
MKLLMVFLCSLLFYPSQNLPAKVSQSFDEKDERVIRLTLDPDKPENDSAIGENDLGKEELYPTDQILKINSQFEGNEFEDVSIIFGDIAVYKGLGNAHKCLFNTCRWPKSRNGKVYIPYQLSSSFRRSDRQVILGAMKAIEKVTCIQYRQRKKQKNYLSITPRTGCWSFVGRQLGGQDLSLGTGCVYHGIVQHELLHALGFHHEQCRSDRNKFVRIYFKNIKEGREGNFKRLNTNNLGTRYDYGSIMHYGKNAFSKNGKPTILPKPNPNIPIGQRLGLSRTDIKKINKLYKCRMA